MEIYENDDTNGVLARYEPGEWAAIKQIAETATGDGDAAETDDEDEGTVCDHCSYSWCYTGEFDHMATCPNCGRKTGIGRMEADA